MKNLAVIEPPRPPAQADRDGAVQGQESAILGRILADDVDLALWERHLDPRVAQEIAAIDLDTVDDLLLTCEAAKVEEQFRALLLDSGYPPCPVLVADVAMLAALHARLLGEQRVTIRLEVVETDACRKFHADFVTVRTITTYFGRGTQWMRGGEDQVHELAAGTVGLFKGRLAHGEPSILHRSPPIADSGETRLVLVIDSAASR